MKEVASDKHYKFSFKGVKLDPYRIMKVYGITDPAQQHAVKKLLRAGRSIKSLVRDIDEVILSLNRWKEMIHEDEEEAKVAKPVQPSRRGRSRVRAGAGQA
jgi:hypothetical protein